MVLKIEGDISLADRESLQLRIKELATRWTVLDETWLANAEKYAKLVMDRICDNNQNCIMQFSLAAADPQWE